MLNYVKWLHTQWPAGTVEKLPEVNDDGSTAIPGVYVVGDLTGIPLLKFSVHTGSRVIRTILADPDFKKGTSLDVAIIGAGVAGVAAAIEAKKAGLTFKVFESSQVFSTVVNFPKGKPIYTYPPDMTPDGDFQVTAQIKEELVDEMEAQRRKAGIEAELVHIERVEQKGRGVVLHPGAIQAQRVVIAIGRSGNYRKIGCAGEELDKVYNRLHDPKDFAGKNVLVVGGGDSALEAAIALDKAGAKVTLSYRKKEFSRPKPENVIGLKSSGARLALESTVKAIEPQSVILNNEKIPNDIVFTLIGREAPLEFFRRSGIPIRGEWRLSTYLSFAAFFGFCIFMYLWKGGTDLNAHFKARGWFPFNLSSITLQDPGFYYSLAYTLCVVIFGFRRIRRRKTPYVRRQTLTLMAFQILPLFLLPYFILPWLGRVGAFDGGFGKWFADAFFPVVSYGHGREYWRAFGFILAWPLFIWNCFTEQPLWGWLFVSFIQTGVIIPLIIRRWGKGAYCGWVCSCGALAETLGDAHRNKMPHGPIWNRLNMIGQVVLGFAVFLLVARVYTWIFPNEWVKGLYYKILSGGNGLDYYHIVDIFLAGIVGVGLYFHFSGRVWCRFACPLAALMHIYTRFSKFRIFPEKSKCISCNVCTSVCHQGIDIMNFANKGLPMEDPECVRCSACVQSCPTGVLTFGRYDNKGQVVLDKIPAAVY